MAPAKNQDCCEPKSHQVHKRRPHCALEGSTLKEEGKDGRFPSHPSPGEGWILHPGVRSKRVTPSRAPEALLSPQIRKTQVVSATRKRPSLRAAVRGARRLGRLFRPDPGVTSLGPAARAPPPACPARPRRAHANAGTRSRECRGVRGARDLRPRSGQAARRRGAGAQGGARAEQGRPSPRSAPPLSPPPAGGKARTATSASGRPSSGHTQCPGRRPPGSRLVDRPHPGHAGPGEAPDPGTPAYLRASAAALSRAGARRWRPLQRGERAEGERR